MSSSGFDRVSKHTIGGRMSKNASQWNQQPKFPPSHFVDSRIYTDAQLFNEEREKIFNHCWIIAWMK